MPRRGRTTTQAMAMVMNDRITAPQEGEKADAGTEDRADERNHVGKDGNRAKDEEESEEHHEEEGPAEDPGQGRVPVLRELEHLRGGVVAFLDEQDRIAGARLVGREALGRLVRRRGSPSPA